MEHVPDRFLPLMERVGEMSLPHLYLHNIARAGPAI
jgi:hypothetical protein